MSAPISVKAVKCKQWLADWDAFPYPADNQRKKPEPTIFLFTLSAKQLRKLSGVFDRRRDGGDASGIQRAHEKGRSESISKYVRNGYPFCDLSSKMQQDPENDSLKKPGWLPTAIVVNLLGPAQERRGKKVAGDEIVGVKNIDDNLAELLLPAGSDSAEWEPAGIPPIEIIDGQHRLFAFDSTSSLPDDFQLPVVAFHELDIGWQAYLFWSINVSPKKINPSHAYDLFPLLRTQDWLEKSPASHIYREARAQELTEILYRHPNSPWYKRINMLGDRRSGWVSQAGWVQAIFNSFLSAGTSPRSRKGLFATNLTQVTGPLQWNRPQQAATLIFFWSELKLAIKNTKASWAQALREQEKVIELGDDFDPAFHSSLSLLNQEQGVRAIGLTINDILFPLAEKLGLDEWNFTDVDVGETKDEDVEASLQNLASQPFAETLQKIAQTLAEFDWRSANAPNLTPEQQLERASYRGTGGYSRLRAALLAHLSSANGEYAQVAGNLLSASKAN